MVTSAHVVCLCSPPNQQCWRMQPSARFETASMTHPSTRQRAEPMRIWWRPWPGHSGNRTRSRAAHGESSDLIDRFKMPVPPGQPLLMVLYTSAGLGSNVICMIDSHPTRSSWFADPEGDFPDEGGEVERMIQFRRVLHDYFRQLGLQDSLEPGQRPNVSADTAAACSHVYCVSKSTCKMYLRVSRKWHGASAIACCSL